MNCSRIAVTGMGVVCAVGRNTTEFADGLRAGRCGITRIEHLDTRWSKCKVAGEVKDFVPPATGNASSKFWRADLLAVSASGQALEQGGLDAGARATMRIGTSVGTAQPLTQLRNLVEWTDDELTATTNSAADAVAVAFGLTGPRIVTSNACAAGASAITLARDHLWSGRADAMLAGGSDALEFVTLAGFSLLQSLDVRPCSPYGRSEGLTLGEGSAVFLLETFEHARARGARVIAELAGCGGSADGYHATAPDPTGHGAALALRRALEEAGVEPDDVDYVNGHGTGTAANDAMERAAFTVVFGKRASRVPISSTKSMVGHTLGAAGAVEAAACVVAIDQGFLPPTVNMPEPSDPLFDFVPNTSRPAVVRVAASNSYAFGGSNGSLVFCAPKRPAEEARGIDAHRVMITGLGAIGGLGEGIEPWTDALVAGRTAITAVILADAIGTRACLGATSPELSAKRYASRADWRKMNDFERMCLGAARLAWSDAGLVLTRHERDNVALVLATAGGAIRDSVAFERAARTGPDAASPNLFPHTAGNGAAGQVCAVLGIHGPMLSLTQGGMSGIGALQHASDLVRRGEVDIAIALAGDELCGPTVEALRRMPWTRLTEGVVRPYDQRADGMAFGTAAVGIVLESEARVEARGAAPYAELLAASSVGSLVAADDEATTHVWCQAIELALEASGICASDVGFCVSAANGIAPTDRIELAAIAKLLGPSVFVAAPKSMTGECVGAAASINVLVAALALRDGMLLPTAGLERPDTEFAVSHVMGQALAHRVDCCLAHACSPGASYGSVVLGQAGR